MAADVPLGSRPVGVLSGFATDVVSTTLTIPAATAGGTYYVLAQADSAGVVAGVSGDEQRQGQRPGQDRRGSLRDRAHRARGCWRGPGDRRERHDHEPRRRRRAGHRDAVLLVGQRDARCLRHADRHRARSTRSIREPSVPGPCPSRFPRSPPEAITCSPAPTTLTSCRR